MFRYLAASAAVVVAGAGILYITKNDCSVDAAYKAAQTEMNKHLKSPYGAAYPGEPVSVEESDLICYIKFDSYVDSPNAFGAMIRTTFKAHAIADSEGVLKADITAINGKLPGF